jgi:hypothetical protein
MVLVLRLTGSAATRTDTCTHVYSSHAARLQVLGTFENGRIEAWLEMRPLTPEEMTAPLTAQRVARRLRAFHRAPVAPEPGTGKEPTLFATISSW